MDPRGERPPTVAVVGAGRASDEEARLAREVGTALGEAGAVVVCGGLGGVMEAAAAAARQAGAVTVGILPGTDASAANDGIVIPLPTGLGEARNALVVRAAEAVIAIGGEWGTLSEVALARKMGIDVVLMGDPPAQGLGLEHTQSPAEAVRWALDRARRCRNFKS